MAGSCEASSIALFTNQLSHQFLQSNGHLNEHCGFNMMEDSNIDSGVTTNDNPSQSTHSLVEDFVLHPKVQNMPSFWITPLDAVQGGSAASSHSSDLVNSALSAAQTLSLPVTKATFAKPMASANTLSHTAARQSVSRTKSGEVQQSASDIKRGDISTSVNNILKATTVKSNKPKPTTLTAPNITTVAAEFGGQYRMSLARKAMSVWMKRHSHQRADNALRHSGGHTTNFNSQMALQAQSNQDGTILIPAGNENYYPVKGAIPDGTSVMDSMLELPTNFSNQNLTFQSSADLTNAKAFLVHSNAAVHANHVSSTSSPLIKKKKWKRPVGSSGLTVNKAAPSLPLPTVSRTGNAAQANVTEWGGVMKWLGWYKEKVEEFKQAGEEMPLCKRVYRDKVGQAEATETPKKKKSKKKRSSERRLENNTQQVVTQHGSSNDVTLPSSSVLGSGSATLPINVNSIVDSKTLVTSRINGNSYMPSLVSGNSKLTTPFVGNPNVTSRALPAGSVQNLSVAGSGMVAALANNINLVNGVKDGQFVKTCVIDASAYGQANNDVQMYYSLGNFPVGGVSSADVREAANADNLVPTVPADKTYGAAEIGLLAGGSTMDSGDQVITPTSHKAFPMDSMDLSWDGCLPSPPVQLNNFSTDMFHGRSAELSSDIVSSFMSFDSPFHLLLEAANLPRNSSQQTAAQFLPSFTRTFAADSQVDEGQVTVLDIQQQQAITEEGQLYKLADGILRFGIDTPAPITSYSINRCVTAEEARHWYDLPASKPTSLDDDEDADCSHDDLATDADVSCVGTAVNNDSGNDYLNDTSFPSSSVAAHSAIDGACRTGGSQFTLATDEYQSGSVEDSGTESATLAPPSHSPVSIPLSQLDCIGRHYSSISTNTVSTGWVGSRVLVTGPYSRLK